MSCRFCPLLQDYSQKYLERVSILSAKKRILGMLLAGALLAGVLAACTPAGQPTAATTGTPAATTTTTPATGTTEPTPPPEESIDRGLIIAVNAETPSVAPARHTAAIGHWKNELTHNGLFRTTYDMVIVPDLVASWTALSDTVFEFTLHEGIMFHNGDEMTAEDVVASWHYVRNYPEGASSHQSVVRAEVVDRYTFIYDTGEPNATMFADLVFQANFIMPKSLIDSGHDFTADPVGSGPYVFEDWSVGDSLTFTRFDNYFDPDRQPTIPYVQWRVIPEGASRTIALEMGEVDLVAHVAVPDLPRLRENPDITVDEFQGLTLRWLLFNHDIPHFGNVNVRRALDMALDKESMVMAGYDGFGVAVWEQFPTAFAGVSSEGIRSFDPEGAAALLAEENIDPSAIGFEMLVFTEEMRRQAEVAQANFADIGIPTTITMIDFASWLTVTAAGEYQTAFGNFTQSNILPFIRGTLHRDMIGPQNRTRFNSAEFSALIDETIATIDENTRLGMVENLTRLANENAAWSPINMNIQVRAYDARLVAPELSPIGSLNINRMYWAQ